MIATSRDSVAVIGRCMVGNCHRGATQHLTICAAPQVVVAGAVYDRCATITELAAFLLDLRAA